MSRARYFTSDEEWIGWFERLIAVIEENPSCAFSIEEGQAVMEVHRGAGTTLGSTRAENLQALRSYLSDIREGR